MDAIYIPQLAKALEQTELIQFEEFLPGLETLTPVKGQLRVKHQGNYLEVSAQAETIVTLMCYRCLQHYNHRLAIHASELIWLDESAADLNTQPLETEVAFEDLVETLSPQGYFEPGDWLYQQLCLELPQQQRCDSQCAGIQLTESDESQPMSDRRWASLEALKRQLSS